MPDLTAEEVVSFRQAERVVGEVIQQIAFMQWMTEDGRDPVSIAVFGSGLAEALDDGGLTTHGLLGRAVLRHVGGAAVPEPQEAVELLLSQPGLRDLVWAHSMRMSEIALGADSDSPEQSRGYDDRAMTGISQAARALYDGKDERVRVKAVDRAFATLSILDAWRERAPEGGRILPSADAEGVEDLYKAEIRALVLGEDRPDSPNWRHGRDGLDVLFRTTLQPAARQLGDELPIPVELDLSQPLPVDDEGLAGNRADAGARRMRTSAVSAVEVTDVIDRIQGGAATADEAGFLDAIGENNWQSSSFRAEIWQRLQAPVQDQHRQQIDAMRIPGPTMPSVADIRNLCADYGALLLLPDANRLGRVIWNGAERVDTLEMQALGAVTFAAADIEQRSQEIPAEILQFQLDLARDWIRVFPPADPIRTDLRESLADAHRRLEAAPSPELPDGLQTELNNLRHQFGLSSNSGLV